MNVLLSQHAVIVLLISLFLSFFSVVAVVQADDLVNINTASAAELDALPSISRAIAERIVEYRSMNGPFLAIEQLKEIKGIGEKTFEKIKDLVTLGDFEPGPGDSPFSGNNEARKQVLTKVEEIMGQFAHEPSIEEVQQAALEHAGIHVEDIHKWRKNVRLQALVPETKVRWDRYTRENSTYRVTQNIDFRPEPDRYVIGPDEYAIYNYDYDYVKYQLQLDWDLNEFVFSTDQLRVRDESEDLVDFKIKIMEEITKLYYDRRRLQINILMDPTVNLKAQLERELRLQELTALIDSMTGGYFLEQIKDTSVSIQP